jgi:hypothetical protein
MKNVRVEIDLSHLIACEKGTQQIDENFMSQYVHPGP